MWMPKGQYHDRDDPPVASVLSSVQKARVGPSIPWPYDILPKSPMVYISGHSILQRPILGVWMKRRERERILISTRNVSSSSQQAGYRRLLGIFFPFAHVLCCHLFSNLCLLPISCCSIYTLQGIVFKYSVSPDQTLGAPLASGNY